MSGQKRFDIMVVGELNVDMIFNQLSNTPEIGKEQKAGKMVLTLGSSTAIFASNAASLGAKVAFCGKIGPDSFGDLVLNSLKGKGVNTDYIMTDPDLQTGVSSIYRYDGDRSTVTYPGVMESLVMDDIPDPLFKQSLHMHTSSIFLQPGIKRDLASLFQKAKKNNLSTSLDTQWDPEENWDFDFEAIFPNLDFFFPNKQEALNLTGASTIREALDFFSRYSTCVVIKMGDKGAVLQHGNYSRTVDGYKVPHFKDAVGAGDSFNAGFIYEYLLGSNLDKCLETGNLVAAISTTKNGGTAAIVNYSQVFEEGNTLMIKDL